jgi:hypothetical protein
MTTHAIVPGDVVQLDPEKHTHHNGFWAANFLVVTRVKPWGVQGYVHGGSAGDAYYRAENGTFEYVGKATWVRP